MGEPDKISHLAKALADEMRDFPGTPSDSVQTELSRMAGVVTVEALRREVDAVSRQLITVQKQLEGSTSGGGDEASRLESQIAGIARVADDRHRQMTEQLTEALAAMTTELAGSDEVHADLRAQLVEVRDAGDGTVRRVAALESRVDDLESMPPMRMADDELDRGWSARPGTAGMSEDLADEMDRGASAWPDRPDRRPSPARRTRGFSDHEAACAIALRTQARQRGGLTVLPTVHIIVG